MSDIFGAATGAGPGPPPLPEQNGGGTPLPQQAGPPQGGSVTIPDDLPSALAVANKHLAQMRELGEPMPPEAEQQLVVMGQMLGDLAQREQQGPEVPQGGPQA